MPVLWVLFIVMATDALPQLVLINPTQGSVHATANTDASLAIDGDTGTYYHSASGQDSTDQWIKFDLQNPSVVSTVKIICMLV